MFQESPPADFGVMLWMLHGTGAQVFCITFCWNLHLAMSLPSSKSLILRWDIYVRKFCMVEFKPLNFKMAVALPYTKHQFSQRKPPNNHIIIWSNPVPNLALEKRRLAPELSKAPGPYYPLHMANLGSGKTQNGCLCQGTSYAPGVFW